MKLLLSRLAVAVGAALTVNVALFAFGASYVVPDDMAGERTTTLTTFESYWHNRIPLSVGTTLWLGCGAS